MYIPATLFHHKRLMTKVNVSYSIYSLVCSHCSFYRIQIRLNQCVTNQTDFGSLLMQQLNTEVLAAECELTRNVNFLNYNPENYETFDFVIIGSGSAGSVVANRLSEIGKWKVLVLEAGGDPTITTEVPGFLSLSWNTELDWQFETEPEKKIFLGLNNRTNSWPRGKVLGGTSVLNHMAYIRGNPKDYDNWAVNNPGWSYKDLLPLFKKSEDMRDPEILSSPTFEKYHGKGGLLSVESYDYIDESGLINRLKKGMKELGYNYYPDVNADKQRGFFKIQGTLRNNRRCSSAKAFLSSAQNRLNLKISKYSHVTKIIIQNNKAQVVQFTNKFGENKFVKVRKEAIVSAGSINTPKLLMLSGIGPENHLNEMKIKTIKNLKVGEQLQDHFFFFALLVTHNASKSPTRKSQVDQIYDFLTKSSGPLSNIGSGSNFAFINTSSNNYPEIQVIPFDVAQNDSASIRGFMGGFGINETNLKLFENINAKSPCILFSLMLLRPKSRGKVLLKSSDPKINPKIFSGFLSQKEDYDVLLKGIEFISNLTKTKALKSIGAKLVEIPLQECKGYPSNAYWKCVIQYFGLSGFHQVGTCRMGPEADPTTVVDSRLRVHGINNIRVADLSITPEIVSSNTQAAAMMIGEKVSELIKEDHV